MFPNLFANSLDHTKFILTNVKIKVIFHQSTTCHAHVIVFKWYVSSAQVVLSPAFHNTFQNHVNTIDSSLKFVRIYMHAQCGFIHMFPNNALFCLM